MVEAKKEWNRIRIEFSDNSETIIYKKDIEKLEEIQPLIDALHRIKDLIKALGDFM